MHVREFLNVRSIAPLQHPLLDPTAIIRDVLLLFFFNSTALYSTALYRAEILTRNILCISPCTNA